MVEQQSKIYRRFAVKVKSNPMERIDMVLREGTRGDGATYISLTVVVGDRRLTININKQMAAMLSILLNQLIQEGSAIDYEVLRKLYPEQESYHFY